MLSEQHVKRLVLETLKFSEHTFALGRISEAPHLLSNVRDYISKLSIDQCTLKLVLLTNALVWLDLGYPAFTSNFSSHHSIEVKEHVSYFARLLACRPTILEDPDSNAHIGS
jgi:hypothetical protein